MLYISRYDIIIMDAPSDKQPERTDCEMYQYSAPFAQQASFFGVNVLFYAIFTLLFFIPLSSIFGQIMGETWEMYALATISSLCLGGFVQLRTILKHM